MKKISNSPNKRFKFRRDVVTINNEPSMTDQSQLKETDINHIYSKYMKTGEINLINANVGRYADLTEITDLGEMLEAVKFAKETFMTIPGELRAKFDNDPENFIAYLNDPQNDEEAIKYGFKVKPKTENLDNVAPATPSQPPKKSNKKQPDLPIEEE